MDSKISPRNDSLFATSCRNSIGHPASTREANISSISNSNLHSTNRRRSSISDWAVIQLQKTLKTRHHHNLGIKNPFRVKMMEDSEIFPERLPKSVIEIAKYDNFYENSKRFLEKFCSYQKIKILTNLAIVFLVIFVILEWCLRYHLYLPGYGLKFQSGDEEINSHLQEKSHEISATTTFKLLYNWVKMGSILIFVCHLFKYDGPCSSYSEAKSAKINQQTKGFLYMACSSFIALELTQNWQVWISCVLVFIAGWFHIILYRNSFEYKEFKEWMEKMQETGFESENQMMDSVIVNEHAENLNHLDMISSTSQPVNCRQEETSFQEGVGFNPYFNRNTRRMSRSNIDLSRNDKPEVALGSMTPILSPKIQAPSLAPLITVTSPSTIKLDISKDQENENKKVVTIYPELEE